MIERKDVRDHKAGCDCVDCVRNLAEWRALKAATIEELGPDLGREVLLEALRRELKKRGVEL